MIQLSRPLEQQSLAELEYACRRETRRYLRAEPSDSRFCLEIFQRALRLQAQALGASTKNDSTSPVYVNEEARTVLVQIYTDYIKAQINRAALSVMPIDDLVQQAWLRFWRAANKGLAFTSLEEALSYLKETTITMLIDERRREHKRQRDVYLHKLAEADGQEILADPAADLFDQYRQKRFRARCHEVLTDPLERLVFWMRYAMGLPPREIASKLKRQGIVINGRPATPRSVSDLLDRSCKRLILDPEIRALLSAD